ncbi:hydantoin racemase [Leucobacter sp. wl10]|nr:hydantoin racemase [Leucobacter sp. wl10]
MPLLDEWYERHFESVIGPDTVVDIHTLPDTAYPKSTPEGVVRFGAVETFFSHYFAKQAYQAEKLGYDAFVTGASQDPGLHLARTIVGIPVLGYGETSFHTAAMTGHEFAIVGFIPELAEPIRENLTAMGLLPKFRGFHYIENGAAIVPRALQGDTAEFMRAFEATARAAVAAGAQLIVPGEGLPNEILAHEGVSEVDGVPILDSDGLVVKTAEHLVSLQRLGILRRSTVGYWKRRPDPDYLEHLTRVFWS